jgi:hypothetical protein
LHAALARVFLHAAGLPCVAGGLVLGAAAVSVGTEGGPRAAVRGALLAAGTAGAVVLGTFHYVRPEAAGIVVSLAALAGAIRFGLGFGGGKTAEAPAARDGARRR